MLVIGIVFLLFLFMGMISGSVFVFVMISVCGALIGGIGSIHLGNDTPIVGMEFQQEQELASINTVQGTSGTFVLGSGTVSEGVAYRVNVRVGENEFKPYTVLPEHLDRIIEDPTLHGHGKLISLRPIHDTSGAQCGWVVLCRETYSEEKVYQLVVPVGSVKNEIQVN